MFEQTPNTKCAVTFIAVHWNESSHLKRNQKRLWILCEGERFDHVDFAAGSGWSFIYM